MAVRLMRMMFRMVLLGLVFCVNSWRVTAASPTPSPEAGQIGLLVGKILSQEHYRRQPLDDSISAQFLKIYLDDLDYHHLMFLQSDIKEFQKYEKTLDNETLSGNVLPGFEIFNRYVQRLEERVLLVKELLKEKYTFDGDDSFVSDRHESPWPATEEEARQLWRQRVKFELLQEKLNKKKPEEMVDTLKRRYDHLLRSTREEDSESVLQKYLTALSHAYDPHSDYLAPSELRNFEISMKLSLVGIGALLSSEDGYPKIIAIVPGGPADLDKRLKVNDRIAAVAQGDGPMVDVVDMKLGKAVELIRGEKNTQVRLLIIPAAAPDPSIRETIKLVRNEIKLTEGEAKAKLIERKTAKGTTQKLGYINLPSFYSDMRPDPRKVPQSTTRDVARLIEKLKTEKVGGLILDLRKNGGGSLPEVISLTGLFIRMGPVVQTKTSRGFIEKQNDDDSAVLYDGPLVVLVSHMSASASEILAAALQDYRRAIIVGDKSTFGKGTVQKVEQLDRFFETDSISGGALKFTTQKFYRISGGSTQHRGVIPDIQLPSQLDYLKINEASLKNALPYDEVPKAKYSLFDPPWDTMVLRKHSEERILTDTEFKYVKEDIERLKAQLEQKTISLNEKKRLQEKKAATDRLEKRKKERLASKTDEMQMNEITLSSLDGATTNAPALTKKVIDEASAALNEASDEDTIPDDVDPQLVEGVNILSEMVGQTTKPLSH
jgi:carboxyl-terminal processing protease